MMTRALTSSLLLILASCSSTFVPLANESELPAIHARQGSDLDSVIYQGEEAEKAKQPKKARSAVMLLIGNRGLDIEAWEPVEDQLYIGFEGTWIPAGGIVGIEVGLGVSASSEDQVVLSNLITFTGSTVELYVGPRVETSLGDSPIRVYVGLGPSLITARFEGELNGNSLSEDDDSFGFYAHVGALFELGKVYLGADVRTLTGTSVTLFDVDADADYTQVSLVFGVRF